ncbi:MAG: class I SAM-dependent methyltransferase [Microthrixaceae bacterium]
MSTPTGNTYDKYGTSNPIARRMMAGFFSALDELLGHEAPKRVLEIGAGEGEVADVVRERWPDAGYVAGDLWDPELLGHWGPRNLTGAAMDATHLPFPDDSFDLVLAIEVLEHVTDPPAVLAELARVGSGRGVVSVPREPLWRALNMARGSYLGAFGNTPGHINHWGAKAFRELVQEHLAVTGEQRPVPWTMLAVRAP